MNMVNGWRIGGETGRVLPGAVSMYITVKIFREYSCSVGHRGKVCMGCGGLEGWSAGLLSKYLTWTRKYSPVLNCTYLYLLMRRYLLLVCTGLLLLLRVSMCISSKAWTLNAYLSPGIGISGVVTMALYIISIF